jgi:drug/metabolite transporter (DMT)-like permease
MNTTQQDSGASANWQESVPNNDHRTDLHFSRKVRAIGLAVGAALLWSSSYVVTKIGVNDIPPITFAAIRFAIAALVVLLLAGLTRRLEKITLRDCLTLGLGGVLGITAYFSLQNLGVARTSASEATLLVASFPVITLLLESLFFKRRIAWVRYAGVAIAILGVFLVIRYTGVSSPDRLVGDLCLLGTGLAWALYNFVTKDTVQHYSTFTVVFWQTLFGTAGLLPLALIERAAWQPVGITGLLSAVYLGIFCSVAAFFLYGAGLKDLDPGSMVSLMNLVPVFGLVLAVVGLKETLYPVQILGGAIVIAGVVMSVRLGSGKKDHPGSSG